MTHPQPESVKDKRQIHAGTILGHRREPPNPLTGLTAVNRLSYQLREKEAAGIIGPNGAGKSTFFNLLTGLFLPTRARSSIRAGEITRMPSYERVNRGISRTFQLVSVFDTLLVMENMMLARIRMGRDYIPKAGSFLRTCGTGPWRRNAGRPWIRWGSPPRPIPRPPTCPTGKTGIGDRLALSLNPTVLLLDEPFRRAESCGNRSHQRGDQRPEGLFALVIVEHRISRLMELVDRLLVINEGQPICQGPAGGSDRRSPGPGMLLGQRGRGMLLTVEQLDVHYGRAKVLHDISGGQPGELVPGGPEWGG